MASSIQPLEIGSLRAVSPDESRFIGSSSGIFFVNTVHRALAISKGGALLGGIKEGGAKDHPSIDECIVGSKSPHSYRRTIGLKMAGKALELEITTEFCTSPHSAKPGIKARQNLLPFLPIPPLSRFNLGCNTHKPRCNEKRS
jgi:hypothetical protein